MFHETEIKTWLRKKMVKDFIDNWNFNIRELSEKKLTCRILARKIGVSPSYFSQILSGVLPMSDQVKAKVREILEFYGASNGYEFFSITPED